jgi:hypothetical protein
MSIKQRTKLTAHQALMEVCALLSTTEGDARQQISLIFDCVPEEERPALQAHPLYLNLKKHMRQ